MRPYEVCGSIVLILLPFALLFVFLTRDGPVFVPGPVAGSWRTPATKYGLTFDLAEAHSSGALFPIPEDNFQVEGFTFYGRLPSFARVLTYTFHARNAWLLAGAPAEGKIRLLEVQREQPVLESVIVVIKYFTNLDEGTNSTLTVVGRSLNRDTDEVEEESEILPDISTGDREYKDGYCQKIVYFGPVDEVVVVGTITMRPGSIILIENVQVVVGPSHFDHVPDLICSE